MNWSGVRVPPKTFGELAQLVERLLCKQDVRSSSLLFSIAVVGSTDEDPVGHFVNENHLDSRPHGTPSIGAAVAHPVDIGKVACSNQASTTALRGDATFTRRSYEDCLATHCGGWLGR